ncbi:MAG TPA: DUF4124 domain-containing protein [Pseudomonadales bacterium]|nr:DUF4124 domain-containing protein [Pseudomonadales bacterium]
MLGLGAALPAAAAELFRYKNEDGILVLSNTLPPKYATRGYTVIDHRGRVIRVVPRQLTESEQREHTARLEAERLATAAREERRRRDEELIRLYSTPEDIERALVRKLASIQGAIDTIDGSIQRLLGQKRNLEARAAELERAGSAIPESVVSNIESLESQIRERERDIATREQEQEETREEFARDRDRLRYLLGLSDRDVGSAG